MSSGLHSLLSHKYKLLLFSYLVSALLHMQAIIEPGMCQIHKDFVFKILQIIHSCEIDLLTNTWYMTL